MKRILLALLLVILGVAGFYWYKFSNAGTGDGGPKQQALTLKKHSDIFNLSVSDAMNAYFDMKDAFVDADTAKAKESCRRFIQLLDSIPMAELKKDTLNIYDAAMSEQSNIKKNAVSLLQQTNITEMRKDFKNISDNLYPSFFGMINYEGEKMYLQNCPMAFGEDKEANWISKTVEVVNPYLGKNHPEFKATMLHCGSVKDTIKAR